MSRSVHALPAALLLALAACRSTRPTEFVNITYTPSINTGHYTTWDFDLEACEDSGDPRVDDAYVRAHLLEAIRAELDLRGYVHRPSESVDFLVSYEFWVADGGDSRASEERIRGRIIVRDVATGRFVWRGERKARIGRAVTGDELVERIRLFAHELLQYTRKLEDPEGPS